jgi:hypothetical protein
MLQYENKPKSVYKIYEFITYVEHLLRVSATVNSESKILYLYTLSSL